jgi:hypothetical protein
MLEHVGLQDFILCLMMTTTALKPEGKLLQRSSAEAQEDLSQAPSS